MRTKRNVFCPRYSECLDVAVDLDLPGWSCEGCHHEHETQDFDTWDIGTSLKLLYAIFKPEEYERYLQETGDG